MIGSRASNQVSTIIGKKGCGKTTLTKLLMLDVDLPIILIDPMSQFSSTFEFTNAQSAWDFISDHFETFKKGLVVSITDDNEDRLENFFLHIYKYMEKIMLIIDEIDMYFAVTNNKTVLNKIVRYGRNKEISLISTAKRPQGLHRNLSSQTDKFYFFRASEPRDLKYIQDYTNDCVAKDVQHLKPMQCIEYDTNKSTLKHIRFDDQRKDHNNEPMYTIFDSGI